MPSSQSNSRAPFCPCLFITGGLFSSLLFSQPHPLRESTPSSLAPDIRPRLFCLRGTQSISGNLQSRSPVVSISHCTVTSTINITTQFSSHLFPTRHPTMPPRPWQRGSGTGPDSNGEALISQPLGQRFPAPVKAHIAAATSEFVGTFLFLLVSLSLSLLKLTLGCELTSPSSLWVPLTLSTRLPQPWEVWWISPDCSTSPWLSQCPWLSTSGKYAPVQRHHACSTARWARESYHACPVASLIPRLTDCLP